MPLLCLSVLAQVAGIALASRACPVPHPALLLAAAATAALAAAAVVLGWRGGRWPLAVLVLLAQAAAFPFQDARALGTLGPWVGSPGLVVRGRVAWVEARDDESLAAVRAEEVVPAGGRPLEARGTVLVSWKPGAGGAGAAGGLPGAFPPHLGPGWRLEARGRLELPPLPGNPGEFNYRAYLAGRGVRYLLKSWGSEPRSLGPAPWGGLARLVDGARARVEGSLAALPPARAALLRGLFLGTSRGLDPELVDDFSRAGLVHILSASGLHVGFVIAAVRVALGRLPLSPRLSALAGLPVVVFYVLLCGARPPVVRSALMLGAAVMGGALGRGRYALGALALAAGVILTLNPFVLADAGFQLSFAATLGLVVLSARLARGLARLPRPLASALAVTCAAQAATLPPALYHFGRFSLIAPLANLAAVPLAGVAVVLGFAGAALGLAWPLLGRLVYWLAGPALWLLELWGRALGGLPGAALEAPRPTPVALAGWSAALVLLLGPGRRRGPGAVAAGGPAPGRRWAPVWRRVFLAVLCLGVTCAWDRVVYRAPGTMSVYFLDVGQGDAAFVRLPGGGGLLLDGGPWPGGAVAGGGPGKGAAPSPRALAFLRRLGVRRLDYLVLSHAHQDHLGGVEAAAEALGVRVFCQPGPAGTPPAPGELGSRLGPRLEAALERRGVRRLALARGQVLDLGGGAVLEVLHPGPESPAGGPQGEGGNGAPGSKGGAAAPGGEDTATNERSLVLRLSLGRVSLLFTGDLGPEGEREVLAALGPDRLACTVLKVAHHGSAASTGAAFLAAAGPQAAVISVGSGSGYGLPHRDVLRRLEAAGVKVYRTDRDGAVILSTDGQRWRLKAFRRRCGQGEVQAGPSPAGLPGARGELPVPAEILRVR